MGAADIASGLRADLDAVLPKSSLADAGTRKSQRKSTMQRKTNKNDAVREISKDLLHSRVDEAEASKKNAGIKRDIVVCNGTPRPIRLDTTDVLAEHLNSLVRETRHAELYMQTRDISRQRKLQVVGAVVKKLRAEGGSSSTQRRDMKQEDWQSINLRKPRLYPEEPLNYVSPALRSRVLRGMEKAVVWGEKAPPHPSEVAARQMSSEQPPTALAAFAPDGLAPTAGTLVLPTPGEKAIRPVQYWGV